MVHGEKKILGNLEKKFYGKKVEQNSKKNRKNVRKKVLKKNWAGKVPSENTPPP